MTEQINIKVKINAYEFQLLEELREKRGFSHTESLRLGVRILHKKEFPAYLSRKEKEEISPEEKCRREGGEVREESGVKKCYVKKGELEYEYIIE